MPEMRGESPAPTARIGTESRHRNAVTLVALGDLILAAEWDSLSSRGLLEDALEPLAEACRECDLAFANLETTLAGDEGLIPKQPRLVAERKTLEAALRVLGVHLVSLGNNHAFDCFLSGHEAVRDLLNDLGVRAIGAGENLAAAARALVVAQKGVRIGWLAFTALGTRPSHVASAKGYGVNPLDESVATEAIATLKQRVDHVVVSVHWGVEYCDLPSPDQIRTARSLVDSGASLVLGHHAHVIQGVEEYGEGLIVYGLGNATTTDLRIDGRLAIRQGKRTRSSFLLRASLSKVGLEGYETIPFRYSSGRLMVGDRIAATYLNRAMLSLESEVTAARWKRRRLWEDVVLRTLRKLHPKVVLSVRSYHFAKLFRNAINALSGRGPA